MRACKNPSCAHAYYNYGGIKKGSTLYMYNQRYYLWYNRPTIISCAVVSGHVHRQSYYSCMEGRACSTRPQLSVENASVLRRNLNSEQAIATQVLMAAGVD